MLAHTVSPRGRASIVHGVLGDLAIALTPLLTTVLIGQYGTRHAFQVAGIAVCCLAAALSFFHVDEARAPRVAAPAGAPDLPNRMPRFALLCGCAMLAGVSYRALTLVQPAYFSERVSLVHFGAVTSLVYLVGVIGRSVVGRLPKHLAVRAVYLALCAISLPLLLMMSRAAGAPLVMAAAVVSFVCFGIQPIETNWFARFAPSRWRSMSAELQRALTFAAGSLAVWLVPWVRPGSDLSPLFVYLAGIGAVLVVVATLFITATAGEVVGTVAANAKVPVGEPAV